MTLGRLLRMAIAVAALGCAAAIAAPLAYVSNEGSASVSVIDTASDKIAATFKVGTKPRGIALGADGKSQYISEKSSNSRLAGERLSGSLPRRTPLSGCSEP